MNNKYIFSHYQWSVTLELYHPILLIDLCKWTKSSAKSFSSLVLLGLSALYKSIFKHRIVYTVPDWLYPLPLYIVFQFYEKESRLFTRTMKYKPRWNSIPKRTYLRMCMLVWDNSALHILSGVHDLLHSEITKIARTSFKGSKLKFLLCRAFEYRISDFRPRKPWEFRHIRI